MISNLIIIIFGIIFSICFFKLIIQVFYKLRFGQSIRSDGPKEHLNKKGTPTMGGIIILISTLLLYLFFIKFNNYNYELNNIILLIIPFIGYGIVGLIDDLIIIIKHDNEGLKPNIKFLLELFIAGVFYFQYLGIYQDNTINFFGEYIDFGFLYGVILLFMFSGFTNSTNFTDGLDGLLSVVSITSFLGIGIYSYILCRYEIMFLCLSLIIVLLVFLLFNFPKAKLFMGDTGSLSIGGVMISMLVLLKSEILVIFFGFIYLLELCSVILQVWYFKKTHGKRIIKMAPIHHHLELCGYSEYQIDLLFSFINILFVIVGIMFGVNMFV